jgi:hypothetical protein
MNTNLVIVPSRSRAKNVDRFAKAFFETSKNSDLLIGIDSDQMNFYPRIEGVMYDINQNLKLVPKLNLLAMKYADKYETITFLGDDHVLKTEGWDIELAKPINQFGYGISFANDLFQTPMLPTSAMVSTNIIKTLGFMCPPNLFHMYIDNFWGILGSKLNALFYFENVIWEHMHFLNKKAEIDESYKETNGYLTRDQFAFHEYLADNFQNDLQKIKKELKIG